MLSKTAIDDFKKCWKQEFEEDISDPVAQAEGERLLRLFKMIYSPIPKKWLKKKDKN